MPHGASARRPGHGSVLPPSPWAALTSVLSFEALVVLYMFAGLFKEDPRFAWIPADPTGLFFALSVVVGAVILVLSPLVRQGLYPVFAGLCLVIWFGVSLTWSPSRAYGPDKVFFMATLVMWSLIAGAMIIAPDRARLRRLFMVLVLASVVAAFEAISVYLETGGGRLRIGSGSYLALGRLCGLGAIVVFVAWLFSRQQFRPYGLLCLALFGVFGYVLFIGGGRGPLVATAASLLLPLVIGISSSRRGVRLARYQGPALGGALLAVGALVIWVQLSEETPETFERLEQILGEEDIGASAATRLEYYTLAPQLWGDAPLLGHGAGSWPLLVGHADITRYPHNLFAEVAVETGLIGLVLLLVLLATALRPVAFARIRSDPLAMCALMLFANTFLNAMVSGDVPGNRAMFLFLGMLTVFALPQTMERQPLGAFLRRPPAPAGYLRTAPERRS